MKWVESQEGFIQTAVANFAMSIARREMFLKFPLAVLILIVVHQIIIGLIDYREQALKCGLILKLL